MNSSQSRNALPVKSGRASRSKSRSKLRGASLLTELTWLEIARTLGLTKRELQIVQGVFDNLPKAGIAKRLKISGHTVHTHLNRLFKKLTVTTRTELVLRIVEQMIGLTLSETGVLPPICRRHHTGDCCLHNPPDLPPAKP
jgi:DNA-binding CsgD family transcriptional regulator